MCLISIMSKLGKKWLLFISVPALIGFIVIFLFNILGQPTNVIQQPYARPEFLNNQYRQIPIHNIFLSPILLLIGIIPLSYYFISRSLEEKLETNLKFISKFFNKNNIISKANVKKGNDVNLILKFLNPNERKIIEKLIDSNGRVLQAEINRMDGMTKLKTHRAVKELERKGIIKRESLGKTNRIILSDDIKDIVIK